MSTMKPTSSQQLWFLTVLTVFHLVSLAFSENKGSNLRDTLRNNTRYEQSSERKENSVEALKIEAQKFLKQCGGSSNQSAGSERNYSNKQNNIKSYGSNANEDRFGNRNNNGQSWENSNNDGDWNLDSSSNRNREQNRPRGSGRNHNNEDNFYGPYNNPSSSFSFSVNNQPDRRNMRQPGGNNQQDYDMWTPSRGYQPSGSNNDFNVRTHYDGNTRFSKPSSDECRNEVSGNRNVPTNPFRNNLSRTLRSSYSNREDDDDDNDCLSQCVLGYMQLLDADRSPSETLIIKWLQEHVTNNEMDRIKALRETRKCFGKLVTTDIEDGCEYAKELSKCLELDIE